LLEFLDYISFNVFSSAISLFLNLFELIDDLF